MTARLNPGIYGILTEKFSRGRSNIQVAQEMVNAGVTTLQYREKPASKSMGEMYKECVAIRQITRDAGVTFIVNDHADLALMVEADGIHTGQDDLPLRPLRKLVGDMIIGRSTHSLDQARQAVLEGADYIGVGPIFTTQTKEGVCDAVGLAYLDHVAANIAIPFVAIGGIKAHNLGQVVSHGARTVCMITEIIGAEDIKATIQGLQTIYKDTSAKLYQAL
ncbi:ThiE [Desulforapulum autotrophicum HRM2]|uniref:Thiamine-phosphate synthase n=1 Tax=Desulforapulum autotrophicum (strain ATCC 43914 / DSM 3382 / VKM B-1955 / HRM2) TaxID=177437 RepID=C0QA61_DESAH|nr:thiamine phosphate synthase [Desulforapulum autotrophicum]ACN14646.1 ThiE [Desulforapulum autotrophicum HRM2]